MTPEYLRAVAFAIWTLLAPLARFHDAPVIASAIAAAALGHPESERWAATMAYYAYRESAVRVDAVGDGGRSCGAWQSPCRIIAGLSVESQARAWLSWVDASSLGSVDSSPERARRRQARAAELLVTAKSRGLVAESR
jgi:hypothetical protein